VSKFKRPHRCARCGETNPIHFRKAKNRRGLGYYCVACCVQNWRDWKKGISWKRPKFSVYLFCPECDQLFSRTKPRYLDYLRKSKSGKLFCSVSCASTFHTRTANTGALSRFKRRRGWSDERWEWERKLVELNLGMDKGFSRLDYGLDDKRQKVVGRKSKLK
jgi:hypothetical protein